MWDTSSRFTAQTSSWCGSSSVSGSGFLSNIRARQNGSGLRRWKSMYNLAPETPSRWSPSEFRTSRGESSFYPTGVERWLLDAHDRLEAQLDRLSTRDTNLSCNTTMTQMFDMKQKQLSETQSDVSRERRSLHEKILKLESDLLQMRSTLDKGGVDQQFLAPSSLSRSVPNNQEDLEKQKKENIEPEIYKLREALKDAEARAKTYEEERNKVLRDLQTAEETQQMMRNKIEEMEKRFGYTIKNHSEVQDELNEANKKISQACLDKEVLSTQVLKLEDDVKELKTKLREALSVNHHLIQDKEELLGGAQNLEEQLDRTIQSSQMNELQDSHSESQINQNQKMEWMKEDMKTLREINEQLRKEAEQMKKSLDKSQRQLQEQITDLEAERSQLLREKEELLTKTKQCEHKAEETCCKHRESVEVLGSEIQKLQDQHSVLEARVKEKEKMLHLQEEEHKKQDEMRVQCIVELKAVASHWTEKWQNVALSLRSTQNELEKLKRSQSSGDKKSDSDLRVELQKYKPEEQKSGTEKYPDHGGESVQTVDTETLTDLSESSLMCEHPSDSQFHQNTQVWIESSEVESLRQKLAEKEKEMSEREHALRSLERLREMEKTEAQIRISALQLQLMKQVSKDIPDGDDLLADVSNPVSPQVDDSRRKTEMPAEMHLKQQLSQDKDDKPSAEDRKDKLICPVNPEMEQQRRMVTEQLKSLFKEREEKEAAESPAQTGTTTPQDWTPSLFVRAGWDRRNWQQSSGLMPVFEEDEENEEDEEDSSWPEEEEDATEETC